MPQFALVAIGALVAFLRPGAAGAYIVVTGGTLEANIADADLVVRGRPEWLEWVEGFDPGGGRRRWLITTVRVSETFKGPASDTVRFMQAGRSGGDEGRQPAGSPADTREALFFLKERWRVARDLPTNIIGEWANEGYGNVGAPILLEDEPAPPPVPAPASDGPTWGPEPKAISMDLRPLNGCDEILSLTRQACAEAPPGPADARPRLVGVPVYVHRGEVDKKFLNRYTDLLVPLDARTAAHARQWASAPSASLRFFAIQILRSDRSEENARALRGMLADPAFIETGKGPTRARYYFLRRMAQDVLRDWGVSVPPARLEDALVDYRPAGNAARACVAGAALLALSAGWLAWRANIRRERGRLRAVVGGFAAGGVTVCAGLAVVLTFLWCRDANRVEEVVWVRGARHRLVSYRGDVQYTLARPWPGGGGAVYGSFPLNPAGRVGIGGSDEGTDKPWDPTAATGERFWMGPEPHVETLEALRDPLSVSRWRDLLYVRGTCSDPTGASRDFTTVRVPCGDLIALTALPVAAAGCWLGLGRWRRWRRVRRGLCPNCGYDLRASTERCPECGWEVPAGLAGMASGGRCR